MKKRKGFLDSLARDLSLSAAVNASRSISGKPDPYKAAGIAIGTNRFTPEDQIRLAALLKEQGAFDDAEDGD